MKKSVTLIIVLFLAAFSVKAQNPLVCEITSAYKACVNEEVQVVDTGGFGVNATYLWNFDGAVIISGSGCGTYYVKWETPGEKHITLNVTLGAYTCSAAKTVVVVAQPSIFNMTGGGVIFPGNPAVNVGLSGSETGILYTLRFNGSFTANRVQGTGQSISFGLQTVAGEYSAMATVVGSNCMREMEGIAVITSGALQNICMVTFDTTLNKNKIIWNKYPGFNVSHFNIYKETYQNNVFAKIGEVPYTSMSVYVDPTSDPLVKSDKFSISASYSAGNEGEKSAYHKTIHLNINPGIAGFNLIWNHYEGFEFLTYRIHRKHDPGAWEVIDSVASNVDSYTDLYTTSGVNTYYIEVLKPESCNPSLKGSENLSVISNTASAAPLGTREGATTGFLVYPNPVSEKLNLVVPGNSVYQVEILRLDGVAVFKSQMQGPATNIDVSDLANGIYLLKSTGDKATSVCKFVKN
ncbi:MAG: T9SS type A sorting domain-containing protein [Bacteroidetes bacterium]|nr:T9SS type A sorting domain-containing protein [Bacteroidota bacterium]